ncbi:hypothetical protein GOB21_33310 [Sinorhizobium meliloti]|uniref:hypothetical protein n=1 Tax=Rhizobium meliloti TaxID=382 RepID=UPI00299EE51E|nr:hypothetical protein [Sinorhizobium meliloti]
MADAPPTVPSLVILSKWQRDKAKPQATFLFVLNVQWLCRPFSSRSAVRTARPRPERA